MKALTGLTTRFRIAVPSTDHALLVAVLKSDVIMHLASLNWPASIAGLATIVTLYPSSGLYGLYFDQ